MATTIKPDDTVPKYRVIKQNNKFYPQRKVWLLGWRYFKNGIGIVNYSDNETALAYIKVYLDIKYPQKLDSDYLVMEQLNSEGISIFKGEKNGN